MKYIFSILFVTFCTLLSFAQAQTDTDKAIAEISQAAAKVKTMRCDFTQTKSLKMLGDKMVSQGVMICSQPDKLRWQYLSPYAYTFILNGSKVTIIKGEHTDVIDVNTNKMFREIARIMMDSVLGNCLTDEKNFRVSIKQDGDIYLATLLPQKKNMKQMFDKIVLHYDRKMAMVTAVELFEKNGDTTFIQLTNIAKNQPVDASEF